MIITSFDDFCTWLYVTVDDIWHHIGQMFSHPGPQAKCSDSELITLAILSECRGWDKETELNSEWFNLRHLFPVLPERSRFNRRRRRLMLAINVVRKAVQGLLDLADDRQCVIDSLPVPVVQFHRAYFASGDWSSDGASYGRVSSKHATIFGFKLHLLVTLSGVIVDFELAPANETDLNVGLELLEQHTDLEVIGDKAFISGLKQAQLEKTNRIKLKTLPRLDQKHHQVSGRVRKLFNRVRQIVETVNGQLATQFNIELNYAHSLEGLCARLYTKLAGHTLSIYFNRWLSRPEFLHIKAVAFPIYR
jgi:hypothetical protein